MLSVLVVAVTGGLLSLMHLLRLSWSIARFSLLLMLLLLSCLVVVAMVVAALLACDINGVREVLLSQGLVMGVGGVGLFVGL